MSIAVDGATPPKGAARAIGARRRCPPAAPLTSAKSPEGILERTFGNTHPHGAWHPVTMLVRFCKSVILPALSPRPEPQPAEIPRSLKLVRHPPSQSTCRSIDGSQDVLVRTLDNEPASMHEVGLQHTSLVTSALGTIYVIQTNLERVDAVVEFGQSEVNPLKGCLNGSARHFGVASLNTHLHGLSPDTALRCSIKSSKGLSETSSVESASSYPNGLSRSQISKLRKTIRNEITPTKNRDS